VRVIDAAGGLIWRRTDSGIDVVLVHRPLRDDWTLPIGRLDSGETLEACAVREVAEETGRQCGILGFLEVLEVEADDGVHRFHIYEMAAVRGEFVANPETDQAPWLAIDDAMNKATYANVRSLLAAASRRLS
jgi:8-oxo-(d)GTP phosphatase